MDTTGSPKKLAGRYEVRQILGQGGMGLVYRAYDTVVRREVAVKTILDIPDPASLQLFYKECDVLASMSHPNNNFYRTDIRNGQKTSDAKIPHKGEKKSFRTLQIHVSPTEIVHQIKQGNAWFILDRWTLPGTNLSSGRFGFYLPGGDQVSLANFSHYLDLNLH